MVLTSGGSYGTEKHLLSSSSGGSMTDYGASDTSTVDFTSPGVGPVIKHDTANAVEPPVGSYNAST